MAHHHTHGGYARAAQRRDEQYAMCITCGQRAHRFQAESSEKPETFSDFAKAMAVAVLLVAAGYAAVLVLAAYRVGP